MVQEQKSKQTAKSDTTQEGVEAAAQDSSVAEVAERKAALDADIDDVLDSIDEVLEENAQAFVQAFIQKGGE